MQIGDIIVFEVSSMYVGKRIRNYDLIAILGRGTFGTVYLAQHCFLPDRQAAIKLLNTLFLDSQEERDRFIREAQFLSALKHPHILPVHDVDIDFTLDPDGIPFMVAEYAPNKSLRDRLNRHLPDSLPIEEALMIISQIGQALTYAHTKDIVHRDLKPENILFNARWEAMIADFGIAVVLKKTELVDARGTPLYMAPEQFTSEVSKKSDQYALGCIAYELFTGCLPFSADDPILMGLKHLNQQPIPPRQYNPALPAHIEWAILKAMTKEREHRHSDVAAFIAALQETAEQWVEKGNADHQWQRFGKAIEAYEKAIQLDSKNASAYSGKGSALYELKQYQEALAAYEHAIQFDPTLAAAYKGKADTLGLLKRYEEALVAYDQAIRLASHDAHLYISKGKTLLSLKNYGYALAVYEQALRLAPKNVLVYTGKGTAHLGLKQYQEALVAFKRAVELAPNDASAYNRLGLALDNLQRYDEALRAYERAIELDPNHAHVYDNKGSALRNLKRYQDALIAHERAIQIQPGVASFYVNKGNVLCDLKRYGEAVVAYDQAIRLDVNRTSAYNGKGNALLALKRPSEALRAYEQAIQLHPNNGLFHYNRSRALEWLERSEEAKQAWEKAKQLGYKC